jgi:hypothetical protein
MDLTNFNLVPFTSKERRLTTQTYTITDESKQRHVVSFDFFRGIDEDGTAFFRFRPIQPANIVFVD